MVNACGLPPAVSIASYVVDSLLLVTGGKSSTDHALSLVSEKDCAMWRVVQGRSVCRPRVADGTVRKVDQSVAQSDKNQHDMAQSDTVQSRIGRADIIGAGRIFPPRIFSPRRSVNQQSDRVDIAGLEPALQPNLGDHATDQPATAWPSTLPSTNHSAAASAAATNDGISEYKTAFQPSEGAMSLCIGSFQNKERAQRWRHHFDAQDARIVEVVIDGRLWHRVLLSPPKGESTMAFVARFEQEMGLPFWLTTAVDNDAG